MKTATSIYNCSNTEAITNRRDYRTFVIIKSVNAKYRVTPIR
jgi:hypothetical protein